jgi:hypothetical protein
MPVIGVRLKAYLDQIHDEVCLELRHYSCKAQYRRLRSSTRGSQLCSMYWAIHFGEIYIAMELKNGLIISRSCLEQCV